MKNLIDIQQFQQFDNLEFIANQIVEGFITGLHRSPFHGFSVEFAEHRIYNAGESTKHIDWRLFARTEKLFIKRYEEETNLRSFLVLDTSSSMLYPFRDDRLKSKLAFSVYSAAALIYMLSKQRDAVGLSMFSDKLELLTDAKISRVHQKRLYAELSKLLHNEIIANKNKQPEQKTTNAAQTLHQIADNIHKRSLVILFSDMMETENSEELFSALQHLRHNKHEVILFHVTDKNREEEFNFNNRPYRFVDMETGEEMKLNPNDVRKDYVKAIKDYHNQIKLKCGQYMIDLIEADINKGFNEILLPYLLKRNKLF